MSLSADILLQLQGAYTRAVGVGVGTIDFSTHPLSRLRVVLADGILTGQIDKAYLSPLAGLTLTPSSSVSLDLSGTTADALAENLVLVKVKVVILYAHTTNTHDIIVGNATNPFVGWFGAGTNTEAVPPGGILFHPHPLLGWPVTAGTADMLKILNGGAVSDVMYDLAILGTSA